MEEMRKLREGESFRENEREEKSDCERGRERGQKLL